MSSGRLEARLNALDKQQLVQLALSMQSGHGNRSATDQWLATHQQLPPHASEVFANGDLVRIILRHVPQCYGEHVASVCTGWCDAWRCSKVHAQVRDDDRMEVLLARLRQLTEGMSDEDMRRAGLTQDWLAQQIQEAHQARLARARHQSLGLLGSWGAVISLGPHVPLIPRLNDAPAAARAAVSRSWRAWLPW